MPIGYFIFKTGLVPVQQQQQQQIQQIYAAVVSLNTYHLNKKSNNMGQG
jgi:hypothetical protein